MFIMERISVFNSIEKQHFIFNKWGASFETSMENTDVFRWNEKPRKGL